LSWTITGSSDDILVAVTRYGNPIIHGTGFHIPYIIDGWVDSGYPAIAEALRRLQNVKADWRILPADAVRSEIIDNAALLKAIKARSEKSIAQISCIDREGDSEPAISFSIAFQPSVFDQVHELFCKLMFGPRECEYTISVGFMTFRSQNVSADISAIPTLAEFKSGQPYFSDDVSVSIRHAHKKDATWRST
jgi:hypothetical protein